MIDKRSAQSQVLLWTQIAEFAKVMNEVGLIEVTERRSNVRPIYNSLPLDSLDHFPEPAETMKLFWRQADFVPKELDEMPLAVPGLFRDFSG